MNKAGKVISFIFCMLGVYTCLLGAEAETAQRAEEICAFSVVFFFPSVLFYVFSLTAKEK